RRYKEQSIIRNRMEGLFQSTTKAFTEFGWLLSENDQIFSRDALKATKKVFEENNGEEVNYKVIMQDLEQAAALLTQAMFSSQSPSGDVKATPPAEPAEDSLLTWLNSTTSSDRNKN